MTAQNTVKCVHSYCPKSKAFLFHNPIHFNEVSYTMGQFVLLQIKMCFRMGRF